MRWIAVALLMSFWPESSVLGSDSERTIDSATRLPATVRQTLAYLLDSRESPTVASLSAWAGTTPQRIRPGLYHWRLADGTLQTVTIRSPDGELISCWIRVR